MGVCQKIMSVFFKKRYFKKNSDQDDVEEDYEVENPCFRNYVPDYAIREKRPFLTSKGSYTMYVVHSGEN